MSLWSGLLRLLGWQDEEPKRSTPQERHIRSAPRTRTVQPAEGRTAGALFSGRVEYVGDRFAKVSYGTLRGVVFLHEMDDAPPDQADALLWEGQRVDFVLLRPSDKKPGEWVVSFRAVSEYRSRHALSQVSPGETISGEVTALEDRGVRLSCGSFSAWVPLTELAWFWIDHPSDVTRLGARLNVEVLRVDVTEGWPANRRPSGVVASLRATQPRPESPTIELPFSCVPFKVWSVAKSPRACDPVALYILEELTNGVSTQTVQTTTGLPTRAVAEILELLTEEGLLQSGTPTQRGQRLIEAIDYARASNGDPIRGLFASAAPPTSQFLSGVAIGARRDYPRSWPRPPRNRPAEDRFALATDEALPELLLQQIATDDQTASFTQMQQDDRLRVFLRRDGNRPWKTAFLSVPEHWLLAGLWQGFEAVGTPPFRPIKLRGCRDFVLVRVRAGQGLPHLFYEPRTRTLWAPRDDAQLWIREERSRDFPELPKLPQGGLTTRRGGRIRTLVPDRWCAVGVSPPKRHTERR